MPGDLTDPRTYPPQAARFLFGAYRPCGRSLAFRREGRIVRCRRRQAVVDVNGDIELSGLLQRPLPLDMRQRLGLGPKLIRVLGKTLVERGFLFDAPALAHVDLPADLSRH